VAARKKTGVPAWEAGPIPGLPKGGNLWKVLAALGAIGRQIEEHMDVAPVARNAIARIAIRRFIEAYKSGEITPQELAAYFDRPGKSQPKLIF
jgi:hypothetical protein